MPVKTPAGGGDVDDVNIVWGDIPPSEAGPGFALVDDGPITAPSTDALAEQAQDGPEVEDPFPEASESEDDPSPPVWYCR